MALGSTHPLTEMSTRNLPVGVERGQRLRLTPSSSSVNRLCRNCEILDVSQHYSELYILYSFYYSWKMQYRAVALGLVVLAQCLHVTAEESRKNEQTATISFRLQFFMTSFFSSL
jgi:hypothetical protein